MEYTKDELKKVFYKENTVANFAAVKKTGIYYNATVSLVKDSDGPDTVQDVLFIVPLNDIGDARF